MNLTIVLLLIAMVLAIISISIAGSILIAHADDCGDTVCTDINIVEDDGYIDDNNNGVNDEDDDDGCHLPDCYPMPMNGGDGDNHNHNHKSKHHDDDNDNHKSNSNNNDNHHKSKPIVEKFKVHVYVDFGTAQFGDDDSIRVIVYGPHTLNKPTLDKPGTPIHLVSCNSEECYQDAGVWSFTSWKVPQGASFKACITKTSQSGNERCGWGNATSRYESIHVQAD